jgi:hypothetical protein
MTLQTEFGTAEINSENMLKGFKKLSCERKFSIGAPEKTNVG